MPSLVKELMLKEIKEQFEGSPYALIAGFEGVSVSDISEFRRKLEKVTNRSLTVKHSLARKVLTGMELPEAEKMLNGNVLVAFSDKEPQALSKAVVEYAKENKKVIPAGMVFEKKLYDLSFVKYLAELPSQKELLTQVVVRVKSPLSGLVMTLSQLVRGLAQVLNEVKKKREAQAGTA